MTARSFTGRPISRFVLVFSCLFIVTATLDIWTTELRPRQGFSEVSRIGFQTLDNAIVTEVAIFYPIELVLVVVGAWLRRDVLSRARTLSFRSFFAGMFGTETWLGGLLLFAPMAILVLRSFAILSNAMYLTIGWSVFDRYFTLASWMPLDIYPANVVLSVVQVVVVFVPVTWLIYLVAKFGGRSPLT